MVYGLSLVSTSVEHVLQKRGTVSLVFFFLCILRYPSLCVVLSSVHKSRSVVKLRWRPQNRFKSCPLVSPSGHFEECSSIRVFCEVRDLFDPVLRALGEVRDVSSGFSAHSVWCEQVFEFFPRTLEAVRSRVRHIW